jgi:hypothetical protein
MLHKIENNDDNRDGFAIFENVATSMEIAEIRRAVARAQSVAGLKTRGLWGVRQCTEKSLKLRMFSNSPEQ